MHGSAIGKGYRLDEQEWVSKVLTEFVLLSTVLYFPFCILVVLLLSKLLAIAAAIP